MSDDLRRTLADLAPRERQAMRQQTEQAAEKWAEYLPRVAAVWRAFADLVADIAANERARQAVDMPEQHIRHAKRSRI